MLKGFFCAPTHTLELYYIILYPYVYSVILYTMKFTDKFFRFPTKLYLAKDLEAYEELGEKLGIPMPEPEEDEIPYVMGWETILAEDIIGYSTIWGRGRKFEDVESKGFDCTVVSLRGGRDVACSWSPELFEQKLNDHYERIVDRHARDFVQNMKDTLVNQGILLSGPAPKKPWWKRW